MLDFFKQLSLKRSAWIFLAFTAFALESTALYFQYGMGLQPCVLCVYERLAVVGLFIAGLIGSAIKGLMISIRHLDLQMNPAPWKQCEFIPNFPETLPFHKWLPAVFNPTGSCNESQWSLFGITMVQWLVFIFAVYVLVLGLITISQVKKSRRRRLIFK